MSDDKVRRLHPEQSDIDAAIAELNESYAVVLVGGKASILREPETAQERESWTLMPIASFHHWFANKKIQLNDKAMPLSKVWMAHPRRRQYEAIVFAPGRDDPRYYNLWKGFAVEPREGGSCSHFLRHIRDNICQGDPEHFRWVISWCADIVQHPDKKTGTSLVLRGRSGTGKTIFGKTIGRLLGDHYVPVAESRYITGRFNSHLTSCLLLHADEGFWAGDHAAAGKLKDLVTGEEHLIEIKGVEPFRVRNYVRLLVTGNPNWQVPAEMDERRFSVLDVGDGRRQDHV
jgi:hypothetical protein